MFTIENHRLQGPGVLHHDSPNRSGRIMPTVVVEHYTAGTRAESAVSWLTDPESRASAHLVIGDDDSVHQLIPFNIGAWHAGVPRDYPGIHGVNGWSIGIEHVNAGLLTEKPDGGFESLLGEPVPRERVGFDDLGRPWHTYTDAQIQTSLAIHDALIKAYRISDLLEHSEVDPRRKTDPGPLFPLAQFEALLPDQPEPTQPDWPPASRTLRIGARGDDVAELQRLLNRSGADIIIDGIFGALTEQAVRVFQAGSNLVVDGIVGPATWDALGVMVDA